MEKELPLKHLISFDKYLRQYDRLAVDGNPYDQIRARRILEAQEPYPELRQGFTDVKLLEEHKEVLQVILSENPLYHEEQYEISE